MVQLTKEEQGILAGEHGRLQQVALENIVKYAEVLGAERLCKVTKATVFCGSHHYLEVCDSPDFHEVFSRLNLARDERIVWDQICPDCYAQSLSLIHILTEDEAALQVFDKEGVR